MSKNVLPHRGKLSGKFAKVMTKLVTDIYMSLMIVWIYYDIDVTILKRCIKFILSLMNSKHTLYNSNVKYCFYNVSNVIGEYICYLASEYNIYEYE